MAVVIIDLNVRTHGNLTFSGLDEVDGAVAVGAPVTVVEPESDLIGDALVERIDTSKGLIYLAVDWSSLHERPSAPEQRSSGDNAPFRVDMANHFGRSVHLTGGAYFTPPTLDLGILSSSQGDKKKFRLTA